MLLFIELLSLAPTPLETEIFQVMFGTGDGTLRTPICTHTYLLTKYIVLFVVAFESLQIFLQSICIVSSQ